MNDLTAEIILSRIKKRERNHAVMVFDSIDSTNTQAMTLATGSAASGTVVIADTQTGGRGRFGRAWASPPGVNLYLSLILRPEIAPRFAGIFSLLGAVAVVNAIRRVSGVEAFIKWPNDVLIGGRKLAGVLLESNIAGARINHLVLGIGLNLNIPAADMPVEIRETATSLLEVCGCVTDRAEMAAALIDEIDSMVVLLESISPAAVLDEWRRHSITLDREVGVTGRFGHICAKAVDVDETGGLILRLRDGTVLTVTSGEVTLR
ncbi:MAG: biotin--[acetyl-CoA-carboxylase] ligase [Nitrospirae bacterium]|nr:biotin--[acetyl-CoA-carboxylase] ligase [Nitrospirota bacterium]